MASAFAAAMVITALVVVARPGSGDGETPRAAPAAAVEVAPTTSRVAHATFPFVDVFDAPDDPQARTTLEHPTPTGAPLVFLVTGEWEGWLKVLVPAPPAGSEGWIRAERVKTSEHPVRVTVDLDAHLLVVEEDEEVVLRVPVSVGRTDAPEPGLTFVTERLVNARRTVGYGSHALTLAGYANGDDERFRGSGLVALHGTDEPRDLGQDVFRGSIGLAGDDVERLYELAPLGTAVQVVGDR